MKMIKELKEDIIEYKRVEDLYNRLVGVEEDFSKFVPKETDLDTLRKSLIKAGFLLQVLMKEELRKIEERDNGNDN